MQDIVATLNAFWISNRDWLEQVAVYLTIGVPAVAFALWLLRNSRTSPPAPTPPVQQTNHGDASAQMRDNSGTVNIGVTPDALQQFEDQIRTRLADHKALLERAHGAELQLAHAKIAELERQLANPEESFAAMQARIADLEARLDRDANAIGAERIDAAKAAMAEGDFSLADEIFTQIEAQNELHVEQSARAAFGRGEVAEAEIRWADAAAHYARAARIAPNLDRLSKASQFARRAGDYPAAHRFGTELLELVREAGDQRQLSIALNEHAQTVADRGDPREAERLYREALEITRSTIGEANPDFAVVLSNLGGALLDQGRAPEAEELYRGALQTARATIGEGHPVHAAYVSNLATAVSGQGRISEAEILYREALEISRTTIGSAHPDYAICLNNLASALRALGRIAEAEELYRQALEVDRVTLGEMHPAYATDLSNLGVLLYEDGRSDEARPLWERALKIREAKLPHGHPDIAKVREALASL